MKKIFCACLLLLSSLSGKAAECTIRAATDRPDAMYRVGEQVTFLLELQEDGKPSETGTVTVVLSKDGVDPQAPQTLEVKDGKAVVAGTLDEPGFLLMRATSGTSVGLASAGFDPQDLKPSMPVPEDFDAFWAEQKANLARIPMEPVLTPVTNSTPGVEVFDLQIPCLGNPVSGYFSRPLKARKKSLPAILNLHGAGVASARPGNASWSLRGKGMLALDINAHGIANGQPAEFYQTLAQGELKNYQHFGIRSRETNYFKGMFLRVLRALDFLAAQPEWDGKTLIIFGTSQGAFQAFAGAALDSRVSFLCAGVPAGCDHTGFAAKRVNGWPKFVSLQADGTPDLLLADEVRYFDNVNYATRIKTRGAAVTVGLVDQICPPTGIYAAYNTLSVPKKMHVDPLANHTNTPAAMEFLINAALEHVRAMEQNR